MVDFSLGRIAIELALQSDKYIRELVSAEARFAATLSRMERRAQKFNQKVSLGLPSIAAERTSARPQRQGSLITSQNLQGEIRQAGLPLVPIFRLLVRFLSSDTFKKVLKRAATVAGEAAVRSITETALDRLFNDADTPDRVDILKAQVSELSKAVAEYDESVKQAAASTEGFGNGLSIDTDALKKLRQQQAQLDRDNAFESLAQSRRLILKFFSDFEPVDPNDLSTLSLTAELQRKLQADVFNPSNSEERTNRLRERAGGLFDFLTSVEKLQRSQNLSGEDAFGILKTINAISQANTTDTFRKIPELVDQLQQAGVQIGDAGQKTNDLLESIVNIGQNAANLENIGGELPEVVNKTSDAAGKLADRLQQGSTQASRLQSAAGKSSELIAQGLAKQRELQQAARFAGDPVGLAGAKAKEQFEQETRLFDQRLELQRELIKQRDRFVESVKEATRLQLEATEAERRLLEEQQGSRPAPPTQPSASSTQQRNIPAPAIGVEAPTATRAQTDAVKEATPALNDYGAATTVARVEQDLLTEAQRSGVEVTPELRDKIEELAKTYSTAQETANQFSQSQQQVNEAAAQFNAFARDALGGFITDLRNGTSAADALENALRRIEDRLIDIALNALFPASGGGPFGSVFGGIVSGFSGGLFGFSKGGQVGRFAAGGLIRGPGTSRSDSIPILASDKEFIVNARATRDNLSALQAINDGTLNFADLKGFADGGLVADEFVARRIGNTNPTLRVAAPASQTPVVVQPPEVRQRIINAFDGDEVVSQALSGPSGEAAVLNLVRRNSSKVRGALGV